MEKDITETTSKPTNKKLRVLKFALGTFAILFVLVTIVLGATACTIVQGVQFDESKLKMIEASSIYDQNGEQVAALFTENRTYVSYEDIPELLIEAFIAVEDQRFYEHEGIDYRSIARAIYRDIKSGTKAEGGSTITQQLVKNVFLTHDKDWMRKAEEVVIALELEKKYSKQDILEMYLNYIYFGHGAHGIAAASQQYFDKTVDELELHEIAMLAALPKAPGHFSPLLESNQERSEQRRALVLRLMADQGRITEEEREHAVGQPLDLSGGDPVENEALWTYIDMVMDEARDRYGISHEELYTGGYQIYTALQTGAQEAMYDALRLDGELAERFFPFSGQNQHVQGSMVIIDHQTGAVTAAMGGRDYVRRGLNRVDRESRQPGSTFKPIVAYTPALEAGLQPYSLVLDELQTYPGDYSPRNYDGVYRGNVTMLDAVKHSYNAPAVWMLNEVGIQAGIETAERFGFNHVERKLGVALGDTRTSPLKLASAYGTYGNNGVQSEPYFIEKITDREGQVLFEHEPQQKRIVTEQTAWYMTSMLREVIAEGTGTRARLSQQEIAGKTGTTQGLHGGSGVRDAWFVGYTPQYVAAVWMGFDSQEEAHVMETSGGNHPALIYQYVMEQALAGQPVLAFQKPEGVLDPVPTRESIREQKKKEREEKRKEREQERERKKLEREQKKEERKKEREEKKRQKEEEKKRKQEEKRMKEEEQNNDDERWYDWLRR
ncbi:transglycosylase domain-containing protein [Bacillus horti]|uniref:Penicillin-binding protein 2A n=1 Tax=Caldalkalibacillus horti TaxID=77523 RepID=A0ABT9W056_9BACI|nr:PBP1A family penicillin-binding protein [Bacillus horti]MDQ0166623.1 penicillin-binding protein 2A [Bacillus horti]